MAAVLKTLRILRHASKSTGWFHKAGAERSCDARRLRFNGLPRMERKLVAVGSRLVESHYQPTSAFAERSNTYPEASSKLEVDCSDRRSAARERSVAILKDHRWTAAVSTALHGPGDRCKSDNAETPDQPRPRFRGEQTVQTSIVIHSSRDTTTRASTAPVLYPIDQHTYRFIR